MKKQFSQELQELLDMEFTPTTPMRKITAAFRKFVEERMRRQENDKKTPSITHQELDALRKRFYSRGTKNHIVLARLKRAGLKITPLKARITSTKSSIPLSNLKSGRKPIPKAELTSIGAAAGKFLRENKEP